MLTRHKLTIVVIVTLTASYLAWVRPGEDPKAERGMRPESSGSSAGRRYPSADLILSEDGARGQVPSSSSELVLAEPDASNSTQVSEVRFTSEDRYALEEHLESLFGEASRVELFEAYQSAMSRLPDRFADDPHDKLLDAGDFEVVGVESVAADGGSVVAARSQPPPGMVFGQLRTHRLSDGRIVNTWVEVSDLGADAPLAVEITWLAQKMSSAR